jgi:hypothetical protein
MGFKTHFTFVMGAVLYAQGAQPLGWVAPAAAQVADLQDQLALVIHLKGQSQAVLARLARAVEGQGPWLVGPGHNPALSRRPLPQHWQSSFKYDLAAPFVFGFPQHHFQNPLVGAAAGQHQLQGALSGPGLARNEEGPPAMST